MAEPQIAYVPRNKKVPVHARRRYLPLVLVPGTMATRLADPKTGEQVWNPFGAPLGDDSGSFVVDFDRVQQASMELAPDETPYERQSHHEEVQHIRHYYNLVGAFYSNLVRQLAQMSFVVDDVEIHPIVYVAGYDWRVDPGKSALRVAEVVEEALLETGERQVIMFSHSQGAVIARYYQRILAGESKVFAYFNLAGANIGFPEVYYLLKNGIEGLYLGEITSGITNVVKGGSPRDLIFESLRGLGGLAEAVYAGSFLGGAKSLLGTLYLATSIGAGRFLSHYEHLYFCRQLPSLYAMLPNAQFCALYQDWVFFDPFATGHPPVGHMVEFPTLVDQTIGVTAGITGLISEQAEKRVAEFGEDATKFLSGDPDEDFSPSKRATRNVSTLADLMQEGSLLDGFGVLDITKRINKMFVDCRNARDFYSDIYTGFMDYPELRSLCAANLEMSFRLHDALTVNPSSPPSKSPIDLATGLIGKFGSLLSQGTDGGPDWEDIKGKVTDGLIAGGKLLLFQNPKTSFDKAQEERRDIAEKDRRDGNWSGSDTPKAYMHPNTYAVVCSDLPTEGAALLLPTKVESRDDHNLVSWEILPGYICKLLGLHSSPFVLGGSPGDERIDARCAAPEEGVMTSEYVATERLPHVAHDEVPVHPLCVTFCETHITKFLPDFLAGRTPTAVAEKSG